MGSVWRVRHQGWNVDLAMKRPQAEAFQTEHQKESFSRECESWINLGLHPNIVSCYYVREIEGVPTIFSEWMENGSLENRIRDGRVYEGTEDETQERLLDIAIQFARGLHYAHEAGLIHQDVKPDNLLLSDRWEAKVADFGLAQARAILTVPDEIRTDADADPGATRMAPSGGYTPAYCSMEQMDGRPLTRRTDVYSWAVSVMELYIGDRPWTNGVVAGLNCRDYFPESRIPMPEALQDLLAACMAPDPKDRPHDFAGIEADLHKIYQTQTGEAYPRPAPEAAADTADSLNNRALSYLDLGAPDQAEACWTRALEADGHHVDSIFNRALSRLRRGKSDLFDVERLLGAIPDQAKQEELYALIEREDECDVLLPEKATGVPSVLQVQGHSGNGQRFWGHIAGKTPRYAVYDTEKKRLIFSIPETRSDGFHVGGLSLSRDGRYAALNIWMETPEGGREEATAVWSMEDSTAVRSFDFPGGRLSPDGSCLVCSRYVASFNRHGFETDREYALDCYNTQTGELLSHREDCAFLGFTWDGKLVVCTMGERVVFGGTPADPVPAEGAVLVRDDLRRDNREDVFRQVTEDLAVLSLDRAFLVCNIRTGEALCELRHAGEDFDYISEEDRFLATEDGQFFLRLNEHSRQISMWRDETEYPYTVTAHVWDTRTWREFFHSFLFNQTFHTKEERDRYIRQINLAGRLRTVLAHPETLHCQPRPQAEYRVSFAQSTAARLEAQETFRSRLREAEDAYASGNTARALRLADEAMAVPGFEAAAEALRLRAKYGAGLEKTGVRRIVPLKETAPAPRNPHAPPDKETLTRCDPILEQLKADILNRWKGRDVYSEYKVRAMVGNGASRDGRFRLLHTLILEERDSPAQNDIEYTDFHGAAVLDTRTWQIVWQQDELSSSNGNGTPTIFKSGHMTMIDHSGARLLVQAGHSGLTLIPIDRDTEPIALMKNTKFRYADFLDDDRFVLAQNEYGWGTVQLFDTREGTLLAEQSFPQTEYGGIHSVSDDCFAIQRGEDCVLCWIDWDYRAGDSREEDASAAADVRTVYDSGTSVSDATVYDAGGAAEEAPFRRGDVLLDTYRIESDPIHGGMGSVWRVRHQGWNVDLAMKRPQAGAFQSQRQKESFVQECESWISLGLHPNIVSCYYVREIEGTPTIFSEWMENGSLENRIRDGSLYQGKEKEIKKRLLDIAIQFARGLHYAHEAGLIHQDVKPDNLLLTDDWEARVADFGLAQARAQLTVLDAPDPSGGDPGMTRMAPSGGYTPAYCSMEQMDGKALTRRTDIYSWAVSVMEMYLGERPWTNGVVAGLNCEEYMAALRVSMHGLMQRLLSQCLAPDPEDRPHDFHAVEMALREVYHLVAGEEYPRPASQAARDTAGSLNNRALSFLDLGRLEDALALWDRALSMDNSSFCCHFNRAAALWKANRITGEELLRTVESREEDSDPWRQAMQAVRFAKPVTEQDLLAPAEKKLWAVKQPVEVLYSTEIRRQAEEDGVELAKEPFRDFQPIYTKKRDENGVYERSLDGRKTISFDPETEEYTVTDGTAVLRLSKEWGYNWQFVDAEGEWIIGHGSDLQLLSAETGHSLLTFHSERDWEGDVIYDNVATVSANGFIRIKNYHRTTDWIRLPPAKPQVDYLLSRVESFAQRREAMERLIRDYPVARMLFRAMEYEAAMHLLSPACEDGTLFYHEEALQLWEDLFPYCTPGRLVTVLQDPRPTRIDDLPFPEEPGTDWETNGASDGRTRITIEEHYTMRENYNNGVDVDFTYSASACDVASGKLYYAMDKLTADAQSDDKLLDYGLKVKLSGAFLWFTKESWGFVGVLGLGYPDEQRKRQLRLALPGLGGYFLRNTEKGLDIGGFFFEDEYSGLEPLWDRQRIFTRKNVYRLIYQYTGLRETPIQVPPDPPEEKPRVIPADIPPIRLDNPKVRPGPAIRIRVRASETPPPDTEERPAEGLGPDAEKEPAEKPNPDGGADPVGGPGPGEEKKPAEEPGPDGEKKKKPGLWARLFGKKK